MIDSLKIVFPSEDTGVFNEDANIYYNGKKEKIIFKHHTFFPYFESQNVYGKWLNEYPVYVIRGNATVPKDSLLIIEHGVTVKFVDSSSRLIVNGRLLALGEKNDSIIFTKLDSRWGGILFNDSTLSSDSSIISYSKIEYGNGFGVCFNSVSRLRISHSTISNNIANYTAKNNYRGQNAGIVCVNGSPLICNNIITNNSGYAYAKNKLYVTISGGGISCIDSSNPLIPNNTISNNSVVAAPDLFPGGGYGFGGGIYCKNSSPRIIGNMINGNKAGGAGPEGYASGGGICLHISNALILNNTIINNVADYGTIGGNGGGISCCEKSKILNCILWNNFPDQIENSNITDTVMFCSVEGGYPGIGNQSEDPMLDSAGGLKEGSPCINAGCPDISGLPLPKLDLNGNPRIYDGKIDVGAVEFNSTAIIDSNIIKDRIKTKFLISPNPSTHYDDAVNVFYNPSCRGNVILTIYDSMGNEVFTKHKYFNTIIKSHSPVLFAKWYKRNKNNRLVSNGTYLAVLRIFNINGNYESVSKYIGIK